MYDLKEITESFFTQKVITFKNPLTDGITPFDASLKGLSLSGLYFNQGTHSYLANWNMLLSLIPRVSEWSIPAWDNDRDYEIYSLTDNILDLCLYDSKYYESIETGKNQQPDTETDYWIKITLESLWLKRTIRDAIEQVLARTVLLDPLLDSQVFMRLGNVTDEQITNASKWVGLRIYPLGSQSIKLRIHQILLQATGTKTVTFYLYHNNTFVSTSSIYSSYNNEWDDPSTPFVLDLSGNEGAWYLWYDQDDLADEKAIGNEAYVYDCFYKYAHIHFFNVAASTDFNTIEDLDYSNNHGINLITSIECDQTKFIKQHLRNFAEIIQLQWAYNTLKLFLENPEGRFNRLERIPDERIINYEISSFEGHTLIKRMEQAYKRLMASLDRLGLKDDCFKESEEPMFDIASV